MAGTMTQWRSAKYEKSLPTLDIPGYTLKSKYRVFPEVSALDGCPPTKLNYASVEYAKKGFTMFELLYKMGDAPWTPIPPKTLRAIFKKWKGNRVRIFDEYKDCMEMVAVGGDHLLFKYDLKRLPETNLTLRCMPTHTLHGRLLDLSGTGSLNVMLRWPDIATDGDKAMDIYMNLHSMWNAYIDVVGGTYDKTKREILANIKKNQERIQKLEEKKNEVFEKAAVSLDELSDRFGIEVKL